MKSRIIWTTGAAGVGKTTLQDDLQAHFEQQGYKVHRLNNVSRQTCEEMGISSPRELTEANYFEFQSTLFLKQLTWDLKALKSVGENPDGSEVYLSDRFLTCYMGFGRLYGAKYKAFDEFIDAVEQAVVRELVLHLLEAAVRDVPANVIYLAPLDSIVSDGVRPDNERDQAIVDVLIADLLHDGLCGGEFFDNVMRPRLGAMIRGWLELHNVESEQEGENLPEKAKVSWALVTLRSKQMNLGSVWEDRVLYLDADTKQARFDKAIKFLENK